MTELTDAEVARLASVIERMTGDALAVITEIVGSHERAAWNAGHLTGTSDMTRVIGWGVDQMQGPAPEKSPNPFDPSREET